MAEIKLVKKYPNIRDEDVTEIFQEGYLKGFENGRKNAIPVEWIEKYIWSADTHDEKRALRKMCIQWEKENQSLE